MADHIVGTWKTHGRDIRGLQDYLNASGQADKMEDYNRPITVVITKTGNDIKIVTTPDGKEPLIDDVTIGKTTTKAVPGVGELQVDCRLEGGQLVFVQRAEGMELVAKVFVEGNILRVDYAFAGKTAEMRCTKA